MAGPTVGDVLRPQTLLQQLLDVLHIGRKAGNLDLVAVEKLSAPLQP